VRASACAALCFALGCGRSTRTHPAAPNGSESGGAANAAGTGGATSTGGAGNTSTTCTLEMTTVSENTSSRSAPALVATGSGYGVAWSESGTEAGAWFARLDENGARLGARRVAETQNAPALVARDGEFLLLMRDAELHTVRLDAEGRTLEKGPERQDYLQHTQPFAVATPSGVVVDFLTCRGGSHGGTSLFDWSGNELSSTPLLVHDHCYSGGAYPALAPGPSNDRVGAAWLVPNEGYPQVHFAELAADGAPLGPAVQLTNGTQTSLNVTIAWAGDAYAVGWNERGEPDSAHLRLVRPNGEFHGDEIAWEGELLSVVALGDELGALFRELRTSSSQLLQPLRLHRFGADLTYLTTELVLEDAGTIALGHSPAWVGGALALAWTDFGDTFDRPTVWARFACADYGAREPGPPLAELPPSPRDLDGFAPTTPCYEPVPRPELPPLGPFPTCGAPNDLDAGVLAGDVLVETQEELAALAGTSAVSGTLRISGYDEFPRIDDLSALAGLRYVGGDLVIYDTRIETLNGLEALEAVGGSLIIDQNGELFDADALSQLRCVGESVELTWSSALVSIAALGGLESVRGSIQIYRSGLTDLTGLDNLEQVGGDLVLDRNATLTDISALSNLEALGGAFALHSSPAVATLAGLENLERVGGLSLYSTTLTDVAALTALTVIDGDVRIQENAVLENVDGLSNVEHISGALQVSYGEALSSFGLGRLTAIGGDLRFENLPALLEFDALAGLREIGGDLEILGFRGPATATSLEGFSNVRRVGGSLDVSAVSGAEACFGALTCVGGNFYAASNQAVACLTALGRVGGDLTITANPTETLESLAALESVGGSLILDGNPALRTLAGLEGLSRISYGLDIRENPALVELDALFGLERVGAALSIVENPVLATCEAEALRASIGTLGGQALIEANDDTAACE
jgi:hypothetical protein